MYGLAFVLLPRHFTDLQAELDQALAPFRRGGDDVFPRHKLSFHDETGELAELHAARVDIDAKRTIRWISGWDSGSFHLDSARLLAHLDACRLDRFNGTLSELEPGFDSFVKAFTRFQERDPETGQYGRWLNPLGQWDWWELGGRFNGVITGQRHPASAHQYISSGESAGRSLVGNITRALGAETNAAEAEIELNVELVETLRSGETRPVPSAVVLPTGAGPDAARWMDDIPWHTIGADTRTLLSAPADADYQVLVELAYSRFRDHAAAGIAYHF